MLFFEKETWAQSTNTQSSLCRIKQINYGSRETLSHRNELALFTCLKQMQNLQPQDRFFLQRVRCDIFNFYQDIEMHVGIFLARSLTPHSLCFQASLQRVYRSAVPRPLASGKLTATAHPRTGNPKLFDPLQSNLARFRDPCPVCGHHGPAELSDRGYQSHGQNVPQQQPQQSLR